jgi:L,D-peptidoglycan transpeptidase YkuD (ErfK/YbiS/YcfS/YnhG family)
VRINGRSFPCALGRSGIGAKLGEGDGITPLGTYALRQLYYRADKIAPPQTALPLAPIGKMDGWCDDPADPNYNRAVKLPYPARHEKLWREDHVYDLIIPMGYNDEAIIPGKGSAIFMHLMRPDGVGTEGCIALKREDLLALLPRLSTRTMVVVS